MSDAPQGPGWWQASDGKWYAPEQHPDYQQPTQPVPPGDETPTDEQPLTQPQPPAAGPRFEAPTYTAPTAGAALPPEPVAAHTTPNNRTPLFVALAVGVVLLLGAGAFLLIRDGGNSTESFCDTVKEIQATEQQAQNGTFDPDAIEEVSKRVNQLVTTAPSEIKSDVQELQRFFQRLVAAIQSAGEDKDAQLAAIVKLMASADAQRLEAASDNVDDFVQKECGITLDLTQSPLSDFESSNSDFLSDFGSDFFSDFDSDFGSDFFSDFESNFGSDFQSSFSSLFSDFESMFSDDFSQSSTPRQSS